MVFMGSEAFPDENAYDSYLQQHGGGSNAYTEAEQTVFHCDVRPGALRGALERFAAQFVAPLCAESATEREVRAVESEFTQAAQSDGARLLQVCEDYIYWSTRSVRARTHTAARRCKSHPLRRATRRPSSPGATREASSVRRSLAHVWLR